MANYYNDYDKNSVNPDYLAYEIGEHISGECENLKNDSGTSGNDSDNCNVLNNDLIPALVQEYEAIKEGNINIYANDDSKCDEDSMPTLASILSRILRFDEAVACILCTYDPKLIAYLKSGHYPQVLMGGGTSSTYPIWQNPSTTPTANSNLPITSGGVYNAIQSALLSVFHKATDDPTWVENGGDFTYAYYADTLTLLNDQDLTELETNDIALIKVGDDGTNQEYEWTGTSWDALDVCGEPSNFSIIEVEKGDFKDKELYWMKDTSGNISWNLMDLDIMSIEQRVAALEAIYNKAVMSVDSTEYLLGTASTYTAAAATPATSGKTTIVLVIGS